MLAFLLVILLIFLLFGGVGVGVHSLLWLLIAALVVCAVLAIFWHPWGGPRGPVV